MVASAAVTTTIPWDTNTGTGGTDSPAIMTMPYAPADSYFIRIKHSKPWVNEFLPESNNLLNFP